MHKYKICVYAICKNEEKFAKRWMDSMSEADVIVVTDTGSEDSTINILEENGALVYRAEVRPWRFDRARNISLSYVPEDVDICVCTDLDEVFEKGWRAHLEKAWKPGTNTGKYIYNWSHKKDGSPDVQMHYSKVHSRHGFVWNYPVHEWLKYIGNTPQKTVFIENMVLHHYPDSSKSRSSYLPLLERAAEENPDCDRTAYYLGREYMYSKMWDKCIRTLKGHLEMPSARWNEERCASMRWIAKSYLKLEDTESSYAWYFRAVAEAPHMREPYVEFATAAYTLSDWITVFLMSEEALKIKEKSKTYVNMGYAWDFTPYDLGAIAAYRLGMYERSAEYAKKALEYAPDNKRLKKNLEIVRKAIKA